VQTASPPTSATASEAQQHRPRLGGAMFDTVLPMQQCLFIGDAIVSRNGMFFALLEADGRLRVYCGDGEHAAPLWESARGGSGGRFFALVQSDANFCIYLGAGLSSNEGWLWGTQITAERGPFHAVLQDDGELCVRCGTGAAGEPAGDIVWRSGVTDPVAAIDSIAAIEYDLAAAQLVHARPSDLYRETVSNANNQIQISMISGSVTVSDTTGWSDELLSDAPTPFGFLHAVPVVLGGRIALSADKNHAYIRNGAATTAKTWGFNAPAAVPPRSSMTCLVSATRSSIRVPYRLKGRFTLASGRKVSGAVAGVYTGSNCHDLNVALTTFDPTPAGNYTINRPLTPMPTIVGMPVPHPIESSSFYQ
jgi:hypothetical protein